MLINDFQYLIIDFSKKGLKLKDFLRVVSEAFVYKKQLPTDLV